LAEFLTAAKLDLLGRVDHFYVFSRRTGTPSRAAFY
jgi:hypothetical protein